MKNTLRNDKYKKSICRHCQQAFRPGIRGRYKFCSEMCRFMNKIKKDEHTGCWLWQAATNKDGYGEFVPQGGRSGMAHRASFRLFKGVIENGKIILHSCNIPSCVNPDHLRQGTDAENALDKVRAGNSFCMPSGQYAHCSKLTHDQVVEIRKLYSDGWTYSKIAELFPVNAESISNIIRRKKWKHT